MKFSKVSKMFVLNGKLFIFNYFLSILLVLENHVYDDFVADKYDILMKTMQLDSS